MDDMNQLLQHNQRYNLITIVITSDKRGLIVNIPNAIIWRMDAAHIDVAVYGQDLPLCVIPINCIKLAIKIHNDGLRIVANLS